MTDAPTQAPPTRPGHVPEAGVPNSRTAIASIACGVVGLLVPLVNVTAIVLGIVALKQIRASGGRRQGQGLAIVGLCAGVVGVGANAMIGYMTWSIATSVADMMATFKPPSAVQIQQAAITHAQTTGGAYPKHVAQLIVAKSSSPVQIWAVEVVPTTAGKMTVGEFDLVTHDGSAQADANLRAALKTVDTSATVYRFGDCWFVRLDNPRWSQELVAAWSVNSAGEVTLVSDAGAGRRVDAAQWVEAWSADAAEREQLGLEPLAAPPWPGPASGSGSESVQAPDDQPAGGEG